MKLYFSPGACSLSPHIVFREAGLDVALERVKDRRTPNGVDFTTINPKGHVPTLQLDNGEILTEAAVVAQYLADRKPEAKLLPPAGSMERYRVQEWLNYIATEIHKGFSPLWNPKLPEDVKQSAREALFGKFDFLTRQLEGRDYLMGSAFTAADAYLFTILNWTNFLKLDLSRWPALQAYLKRVGARPAVQAAMKAEGLL